MQRVGKLPSLGHPDLRIEAVPGTAHAPEELDDFGVPTGYVRSDLLEDANGTFAAAIVNRLRCIQALAARVEAGDQVGGERVGDVRNYPIVASLDRLVLPQAIDAAPQNGGLRGDAVHYLAQWTVAVE